MLEGKSAKERAKVKARAVAMKFEKKMVRAPVACGFMGWV